MKYISLFTGIGGFEIGLEKVYPQAECLFYSEIDPYAIKIYQKKFPDHKNIGDITAIDPEDIEDIEGIQSCDLITASFPCTNLSSMANFRGNNRGIDGPKSGLFHDMVRVMGYIVEKNPSVKFIVENNFSMRKDEREKIFSILQQNFSPVYQTVIDNAMFGVQTRKRIIWTNFPVQAEVNNQEKQTWTDVLEPLDSLTENDLCTDAMVECLNKLLEYKNPKGYTIIAEKDGETGLYKFVKVLTTTQKSRWEIQKRSDTSDGNCKPIVSHSGGGNNLLIDRRFGNMTDLSNKFFRLRKFTVREIERLFGFPDGFTEGNSVTRRKMSLGNSIPVFIVKHVLKNLE